MKKRANVCKGTYGLDNYHDPERLMFDPEQGIVGLSEAVNIVIDDTYRPRRREGYTQLLAGNFHSLCHFGSIILAVQNYGSSSALVSVASDFSGTTALVPVTDGATVNYQKVLENIYFCNGFERGIVSTSGVYSTWEAGTYYGPTRTHEYSDPPTGTDLFLHGGRMFIVEGNMLWYSIPFGYSQYRKAADFLWFESDILMAVPVTNGIWLSDEEKTYFIGGREVTEFTLETKADYPAVMGTSARIEGPYIANGSLEGIAAVWTSTEGICVGTNDGQMLNMTASKLDIPEVSHGTALVSKNEYIVTLEG